MQPLGGGDYRLNGVVRRSALTGRYVLPETGQEKESDALQTLDRAALILHCEDHQKDAKVDSAPSAADSPGVLPDTAGKIDT